MSKLSNIDGASKLPGQTPKMPVIPAFMDIRVYDVDTELYIYHFRDGEITLERRRHGQIKDDEDQLQETLITLMKLHFYSASVQVALAFDFPEPLSKPSTTISFKYSIY